MTQSLNLEAIKQIDYRVLIVDDDVEIRNLLANLLVKQGFIVYQAESGNKMANFLSQTSVDIILLDIMLGDSDGFEICKRMSQKSAIPLIIISAMNHPYDRVLGLELGADDYIVKPFYSREVVARIKAVLRRRSSDSIQRLPGAQKAVRFEGWTLYPDSRRLFDSKNIEVSLSVGEYVLLIALLENPNKIVSRDSLLSYIHAYHEQDVFDRSIDVQICRLRKRIENNSANPTLIKTIRGEGYMLEASVEKITVNNE